LNRSEHHVTSGLNFTQNQRFEFAVAARLARSIERPKMVKQRGG
jgi:hypothetical protein